MVSIDVKSVRQRYQEAFSVIMNHRVDLRLKLYSQTVWNQKTEKLARNSLMFADGVSVTSPAQGVQVSAAN